MSASQPWCSQGSTRKTPPRWSFRRTRGWLQKYSEACSTRLRRARSLPDLRLRDYAHRIGHVSYLISIVTIGMQVVLVGTEGNYPSSTRVGLLS
jgi:hypothetical protein